MTTTQGAQQATVRMGTPFRWRKLPRATLWGRYVIEVRMSISGWVPIGWAYTRRGARRIMDRAMRSWEDIDAVVGPL